MRNGRLRHRITIQQATDTVNELHEPVPTWAALYSSVPACVETVSAGETWRGVQVMAGVTSAVSLHSLTGITAKMRVLFGVRILYIEQVVDRSNRGRELMLMCKEDL